MVRRKVGAVLEARLAIDRVGRKAGVVRETTGLRAFETANILDKKPTLARRGPMAKARHLALSHSDMPEDGAVGPLLHKCARKVGRVGNQVLADRAVAVPAGVVTLDAAVEEEVV